MVKGKKGLDAFPGSDLEDQLKANGIETVAIGGFLTNCCVESTMRTAYEKGFNVITLTDCSKVMPIYTQTLKVLKLIPHTYNTTLAQRPTQWPRRPRRARRAPRKAPSACSRPP